MFTLEYTTDVAVPPDHAFSWIADIANLPKWQSGVFNSEILTPGPMRIGTRFRERFKLMGMKLTAECEVTEMTPPKAWAFKATGSQMDYQGRFTLSPASGGTRLTQRGNIAMKGIWRLLEFMARSEASREVKSEQERLKTALEADYRAKSRT